MTDTGQTVTALYAALTGACAAVLLATGGGEGARRARLLLAGPGQASGGTGAPDGPGRLLGTLRRRARERTGHQWWCPVGGAVVGLAGESWLPVVAGAAALPLVARLLRHRNERQEAERRESAVVELCGAVAGELRAGRQPDEALLAAGEVVLRGLDEDGPPLLAAARFGGDVPEALRKPASAPGASGLLGMGACWQVSVEGGAGLADGLDRVAAALSAERDEREDLRAQLAGPRATAAVLAILPAFGLLLGSAMGADPLRVLLHTPAGWGCLLVGGLLEAAGLLWVTHLVRGAEQGETAPRRVPAGAEHGVIAAERSGG